MQEVTFYVREPRTKELTISIRDSRKVLLLLNIFLLQTHVNWQNQTWKKKKILARL